MYEVNVLSHHVTIFDEWINVKNFFGLIISLIWTWSVYLVNKAGFIIYCNFKNISIQAVFLNSLEIIAPKDFVLTRADLTLVWYQN